MAEKPCNVLVTIVKSLQSTDNLDIHPRSPQLLLLNNHFRFVDCCFNVYIVHHFQDTTTFKVNVTAFDLEKSLIFDNEA